MIKLLQKLLHLPLQCFEHNCLYLSLLVSGCVLLASSQSCDVPLMTKTGNMNLSAFFPTVQKANPMSMFYCIGFSY